MWVAYILVAAIVVWAMLGIIEIIHTRRKSKDNPGKVNDVKVEIQSDD